MAELPQEQLNQQLAERFKQLPKVIQDAITSADVQKQLRQLADTQKLHVDQWQILENNVMLTLLGFQDPSKLADELHQDLEIPADQATQLAAEVSKIVFDPVRGELERELNNPEAKAKEVTVADAALQAEAAQERPAASLTPPTPSVAPATPPPEKPVGKAVRAPAAESYKPGESSIARKTVHDDPYREPPA